VPVLAWTLGAAWGLLGALPLARAARRVATTARTAALTSTDHDTGRAHTRPRPAWVDALVARTRLGPVARVVGVVRGRRRARVIDAVVARELPVVIDLIGVAVGAGCTPYLAVEVAATWSPPAVAASLLAVLRSCALGVSFDAALADAVRATPRLGPLGDALLAAERLGSPVGPVLTRLAAEERTALRRRAEAHARRIPVRLLFPLVFLVLPAFVLLTVVPGVAAGLGRL
jgi:Type II secretion system (T2SS), protein F